jgi:hypothetical protein
VFATVLELSGVDVEAVTSPDIEIDSVSLLPVLRNQPGPRRTWAYAEQFGTFPFPLPPGAAARAGTAIRSPRYKLIRFEDGDTELYDLVSDPYEANNLMVGALSDPQRLAYAALTKQLDALRASQPSQ